jgi:hypothetical protein
MCQGRSLIDIEFGEEDEFDGFFVVNGGGGAGSIVVVVDMSVRRWIRERLRLGEGDVGER